MTGELHKKAIERMYTDCCTVTAYEKYKKENKTTAFRESILCENTPCRLSFWSVPSASGTGTVTAVAQSVTLFLSPEIEIKPGSKITVTHDGRTTDYKQSGFPKVYSTHQEIALVLYDDKA